MSFDKYVAIICEESAELAIIDILLDSDFVPFERECLIEGHPIKCREAKVFEQKYLGKGFDKKITIFRILDSRRENLRLSKAHIHKVDVINIITSPEIEILIILSENEYDHFKNSRKKPSSFCKENLKMKNVKTYDFVKSYFSSPRKLVNAIRKYNQVSSIPKGEYSLFDLLKK